MNTKALPFYVERRSEWLFLWRERERERERERFLVNVQEFVLCARASSQLE
jgi:hypothetical protein